MSDKKYNKIYVLDTSALLQDPNCLTHYKDSKVIIPVTVLSELDKQKNRMDAVGRNARFIPRILNKYRGKNSLAEGIDIEDLNIRIEFCIEDIKEIPPALEPDKPDNRILGACLQVAKGTSTKVTLVTNDAYLAIKAQVYGILSQEFHESDLLHYEGYTGHRELTETHALNIDKIYKDKKIKAPKNYKFKENEFCLITSKANSGRSVRVRYNRGNLELIASKLTCGSISPLNNEQDYLMSLLLDPSISLVTVAGPAGTGKTLVSIACGIQQVVGKEPRYRKLVISRSLELMSGRDKLGYLKGGLEEKLAPFILPLKDAVDFVLGEDKDGFEYLQKNLKKLEVEPLQYIRGRSINNTYFIVDEAQNLSRADIKTIVTRIGENSKIILLGDLDQIDNTYLTKTTNGLAQIIEKFKDCKLAGHITLQKGVRSDLATIASSLL